MSGRSQWVRSDSHAGLLQLLCTIPDQPAGCWKSTLDSLQGDRERFFVPILQCFRRQLSVAGSHPEHLDSTAAILDTLLDTNWIESQGPSVGAFHRGLRRMLIEAIVRAAENTAAQTSFLKWMDKLEISETNPWFSLPAPIDLETLARNWNNHLLGSHTVLFPTYIQGRDAEPGQLVVAKVHVVKADTIARGIPPIVPAPWSFFEWVEDDRDSQLGLQQNLATALATLPIAAGAADNGAHQFVLELAPLSSLELLKSREGASIRIDLCPALWELTPATIVIRGPSLGVAVALAAWAAKEKRFLRPFIATGEIRQDGRIVPVAGMESKLAAVQRFLDLSERRWQVIVPSAGGLPFASHAMMQAGSLAELGPEFLTDGFDAWRKAVLDMPVPTLSDIAIGREGSRIASGADAVTPSKERDVESLGIVTETIERLSELLAESILVGDSGPRLQLLVLRFNENPQRVAWDLTQAITRRMMDRTAEIDRADAPVVLPIQLARLPSRSDALRAKDLAAALTMPFESQLVSEIVLRISLDRKDKLWLLLYEESSLDLADRGEAESQAREHLRARLASLAIFGIDPWRPQRVAVLCSDEHHRRQWRKMLDRR